MRIFMALPQSNGLKTKRLYLSDGKKKKEIERRRKMEKQQFCWKKGRNPQNCGELPRKSGVHTSTLALVRTPLPINLFNFLEGEGLFLFAYLFYFAENLKAVRLADRDSFPVKEMS